MATIKAEGLSKESRDLNVPFLDNQPPAKLPKTPRQKAIRKAIKGTAHLANLLPTGSVLIFQILCPIVTHNGECKSFLGRTLTLGFLTVCGISCFLLCFTDSFRDRRGKVRYGLATFQGLRVIDGSSCMPPPEEAEKFRLRFADFVHAAMTIMVFAVVATFDKNVIKCLCGSPSEETRAVLSVLPVAVGAVCSLLFVLFPSRRHGIGFPLSRH